MMKLKLSINTQILRNQKVSVYLKNTRKQKVMELYLQEQIVYIFDTIEVNETFSPYERASHLHTHRTSKT